MKKTLPIIVIAVVLVFGGIAYMGRHAIKRMLGGAQATPTEITMEIQPSSMAPSNNIYQVKTDSTKGEYVTDFQGMALYTYDKDTTGVSNCSGGCLKAWPAYSSGATAQGTFPANVAVITRTDDNTSQFTWKGLPLYYFAKDTKAGDISGDGVGGVWHLVKP